MRIKPLFICALVATSALAALPAVAASFDAAVSTPVDDPYYPERGDPNIDVLHYRLDLEWRPNKGLKGLAELYVRSVVDQSSLQLDLSRHLDVNKVRVDGSAVAFSHDASVLHIDTAPLTADSRHSVAVTYAGMPHPVEAPSKREDIPYVGWKTRNNGSVWAMQEPFGAFTWYPVNDHPSDKAYYDVRLDVPRRFVGVSGGKLMTYRHRDGRTITDFRLSDPAASYLVTVAINDLRRARDQGPRGLPISYWVPRGNSPGMDYLRQSPSMLRWLEDHLGRYPFDRAGVVVVPSTSAMETQELVTMGNAVLRSRKAALSDLFHEYSHQWYGDTVTPNNWVDLWMNESFAMYLQFEYEIDRGWETKRSVISRLNKFDAYFRYVDGPPGAYDKKNFASGNVYYCGALMLYTLKDRIGAKAFNEALRAWPQRHANANVDRDDYIDWISARTGQNLRPFITKWLMSPTTP